jgi:hypothetical protein
MTDTIFFRLGPNNALGADDLQVGPIYIEVQLATKDWQAIFFVRSTKAILLRCLGDAELTDAGRSALEKLEDTFDDGSSQIGLPEPHRSKRACSL